jgi:4,5-DOPA dioxygenase extradiol
MPDRMPAIFLGHGNPMNALARNRYTEAWREIAEALPTPRAVLCVSAHWYVSGTAVTAMDTPRTIHDFGGFPRELFEFEYPAPGDRELAEEVAQLLRPTAVALDHKWGLDHGTWSVLCHLFPNADVPVVQLSIDETLLPGAHYEIGRGLAPLRDRGVLILGSGNLVHNLHTYAWGNQAQKPYDWALRFETQAREWMAAGNHEPLIDYESVGRDAVLSAPTPEHFLPLLYVLGAQRRGDAVTFPVDGMDGGSVSMLSVRVGQ